MERENKYWLREDKKPYYYEYDLTHNPGVYLKMFEIFDGKDVKWGIREDYIKITSGKYCRISPLFQNMQDELGHDQERFIYLKDYTFIIHGKLNNSEVLCKINNNTGLDDPLVEIEDFGGKNVRINEIEDKIVYVKYMEDGLYKCLYFDCNKFKPCSNIFDAVYTDNFFLKSYTIDDEVRVFVGMIHSVNHTVKQCGYDINNREYIDFPITDDGLLDEEEMNRRLNEEDFSIGFNRDYYDDLDKINLITMLIDLGIDGFEVLYELHERNQQKIKRK